MTNSTDELPVIAQTIREKVVKMLLTAGSGHSAGSLGMSDVLTALYFGGVIKHKPAEPWWSERDYVLLSNGHICPVLYATLAQAGYFFTDEIYTLRQLGSRLQGHPQYRCVPGIENTSGPLGQGLSQSIGLALSFRQRNLSNHIYCLMSDGEHQEGQTWEAYHLAGARQLNNITVIIDRNNIQIDGFTEDIVPLQPLRKKIESFRWQVIDVDGHDIPAIIAACQEATLNEQPTVLIAHTIPGKGVDFMEDLPEWHGKSPSLGDSIEAIQQLRSLSQRISF